VTLKGIAYETGSDFTRALYGPGASQAPHIQPDFEHLRAQNRQHHRCGLEGSPRKATELREEPLVVDYLVLRFVRREVARNPGDTDWS